MTDLIKDGGAAFPQGRAVGSLSIIDGGMSLRDWFAGQALAGLVHDVSVKQAGQIAYQYADAMIAARKGGAA